MDYFFGCYKVKGHFLYDRNGQRHWRSSELENFPFKDYSVLDGNFLTKEDLSIWWLNDEWTLLAWKDNTVDKRPGSNAVIMLNGAFDLDRAYEYVKEKFPSDISSRLDKFFL